VCDRAVFVRPDLCPTPTPTCAWCPTRPRCAACPGAACPATWPPRLRGTGWPACAPLRRVRCCSSCWSATARRGLTPSWRPRSSSISLAANTDPAQPLVPPPGRSGRVEVGQSAFSMNALNELAPFWDEFHAALDALGIRADTWIHEVGTRSTRSTCCTATRWRWPTRPSCSRWRPRKWRCKHGLNAVFMAKPIAGQARQLHAPAPERGRRRRPQRLQHARRQRGARPGVTSSLGCRPTLPDLMLMFAPFGQFFQALCRRQPGAHQPALGHMTTAPPACACHCSSPAARRVENRIAGADANPYLAIAATLAAGLAGMQEQLTPTEPVRTMPTTMRTTCRARFDIVPRRRMTRARHAVRRLMHADFVQAYLAVKALEHDSFMRRDQRLGAALPGGCGLNCSLICRSARRPAIRVLRVVCRSPPRCGVRASAGPRHPRRG
jgi:glutamine synthetase